MNTKKPENRKSFDRMMTPRSIAVVGASANPQRIGGRPILYLKHHGYMGKIFPVTKKGGDVQGLPAYTSLHDIGEPIDQVVIALGRDAGLETIYGSEGLDIGSFVVYSSGFSEVDAHGAQLQLDLARHLQSRGVRLLGPNCMGMVNARLGAVATFNSGHLSPGFKPGGMAIISQSGAIGAHLLRAFSDRGIGTNFWVATGNEADVSVNELISWAAADTETDVIALYLEVCRDGEGLRQAFSLARENNKPIVVLKPGRYARGQVVAASHTGTLAGDDAIYDAVFRQYNVTRTLTLADFIDASYAFSAPVRPRKIGIGAITVSGGVGAMFADTAEEIGLPLPPIDAAGQQAVLKHLPVPAGVGNPVDLTGQIINDIEILRTAFDVTMSHPEIGSAIAFVTTLGVSDPIASSIVEICSDMRGKYPQCRLVISAIASPDFLKAMEQIGVTVFEDPTQATLMTGLVIKWMQAMSRADWQLPLPNMSLPKLPTRTVSEFDAKLILENWGVGRLTDTLVSSMEEAVRAASATVGAVVLKINSPDIAHKTEVGGVILGLSGDVAVSEAYHRILSSVAEKAPDAHLDGIIVSPMADDGVDTIIGMVRDQVFGPVMMLGLGGVSVEIMKDVTFRLAPFSVAVARDMISELRGKSLLEEFRGRPAVDTEALAETLARLSVAAAAADDRLNSFEINPLRVMPDFGGVIVLDALIDISSGGQT